MNQDLYYRGTKNLHNHLLGTFRFQRVNEPQNARFWLGILEWSGNRYSSVLGQRIRTSRDSDWWTHVVKRWFMYSDFHSKWKEGQTVRNSYLQRKRVLHNSQRWGIKVTANINWVVANFTSIHIHVQGEQKTVIKEYEWRTFTVKWNRSSVQVFNNIDDKPFLHGEGEFGKLRESHVSIFVQKGTRIRVHECK